MDLPKHKGWYTRGYLPHADANHLTQHITFHLADSLPQSAKQRLLDQQTINTKKRNQDFHQRLDQGYGSCILNHVQCAQVLQDTLLFGHNQKYKLMAWCIMPNHVHVLIEQIRGWPLGRIVQSWKRHSTREIKNILESNDVPRSYPKSLPIWQREYWDRFMRSDEHLLTTISYIERNPVKAGLVKRAEEWRWSSAWSGWSVK